MNRCEKLETYLWIQMDKQEVDARILEMRIWIEMFTKIPKEYVRMRY